MFATHKKTHYFGEAVSLGIGDQPETGAAQSRDSMMNREQTWSDASAGEAHLTEVAVESALADSALAAAASVDCGEACCGKARCGSGCSRNSNDRAIT